jgi:hypothetical protein
MIGTRLIAIQTVKISQARQIETNNPHPASGKTPDYSDECYYYTGGDIRYWTDPDLPRFSRQLAA